MRGRLNRQPGLADTSRANEGEETHPTVEQRLADGLEFVVTANKPVGRDGKRPQPGWAVWGVVHRSRWFERLSRGSHGECAGLNAVLVAQDLTTAFELASREVALPGHVVGLDQQSVSLFIRGIPGQDQIGSLDGCVEVLGGHLQAD